MSAIDELPPLRDIVRKYDLAAKKSLGQNFLFDLNLTRRIARAAGPLEGVCVIEIGPGPGGLTRALLAEGAARVIAVERDARCLPALAELAAAAAGRLDIVAGDARTIDLGALARERAAGAPARICANLPYNIATVLLAHWLAGDWPPWFDRLTLMFQREVAERIVATPNERKDYGRLAVLCGWRTRARILFDVPASAFTPPPKVTSSVVELVPAERSPALQRRIARRGHPQRLRPAPQDAAAIAEEPGDRRARDRSRRLARGGRDRADAPRRGNRCRRLRAARPRARRG